MKKIFLTSLLVALTLAASAQIGLGGQLGVNTTGGSNHFNRVSPTATGSYDYSVRGDNLLLSKTTITLLPQVSYSLNDKLVLGTDIGAVWEKTTNRNVYTTLREQVEGFDGWQSTTAWRFVFAPYLRYNFLQADRWKAFCEAQLSFSLTPNATRHVYMSAYSLHGVDHPEVDADDLSYSYHESSIGFTVVPGVSYQLTDWLSADLYIDLLGLGFIHSHSTTFNDYTAAGGATNTNEITQIENRFYLTADFSSQELATHLFLFRMAFSISL